MLFLSLYIYFLNKVINPINRTMIYSIVPMITNNFENPYQPEVNIVLDVTIIFQSQNQIGNAHVANRSAVLKSYPAHLVFGRLGTSRPHSKTYPYRFYS